MDVSDVRDVAAGGATPTTAEPMEVVTSSAAAALIAQNTTSADALPLPVTLPVHIEDSAQEGRAAVVDLSVRSGTLHTLLPVSLPDSEVVTATQFLMVPLPTAGTSGLRTLPASAGTSSHPPSSTKLVPDGDVRRGRREDADAVTAHPPSSAKPVPDGDVRRGRREDSDARASSSLERQRHGRVSSLPRRAAGDGSVSSSSSRQGGRDAVPASFVGRTSREYTSLLTCSSRGRAAVVPVAAVMHGKQAGYDHFNYALAGHQ